MLSTSLPLWPIWPIFFSLLFSAWKCRKKQRGGSRLLTFIVITCYLQSRKTKNKNQSELKTTIFELFGTEALKDNSTGIRVSRLLQTPDASEILGLKLQQSRHDDQALSRHHDHRQLPRLISATTNHRKVLSLHFRIVPILHTHTHTQLHFHIYTHTHEHTHEHTHTIFTSDHHIFTRILIFFSSKKLGRFCLKTDGIKLTFYFYFAKLILDIFISYPDGAHFI